jgi:hypothetical protein
MKSTPLTNYYNPDLLALVPKDASRVVEVGCMVIEHLYDPWAVLGRIHKRLPKQSSIVACIPNAQHWSVQARLNCGPFRYEERGLMDRTHIRWFTKTTITELFRSTGFEIVDGDAVVRDDPHREAALVGIQALAAAIETDVEEAAANATAFQWIVRAIPAPAAQS